MNIARFAAVAALAFVSCASFADSADLQVTANVSATCLVTDVPKMAFSLDPTKSILGQASSAVEYKCTKGVLTPKFQVGTATNGATGYSGTLTGTGGTTGTMSYAIKWATPANPAGKGFASDAGIIVTLNGEVAASVYQAANAGDYVDTVSITVTP